MSMICISRAKNNLTKIVIFDNVAKAVLVNITPKKEGAPCLP